jgi:hypothetical protein
MGLHAETQTPIGQHVLGIQPSLQWRGEMLSLQNRNKEEIPVPLSDTLETIVKVYHLQFHAVQYGSHQLTVLIYI